jgi:hypothetical protein
MVADWIEILHFRHLPDDVRYQRTLVIGVFCGDDGVIAIEMMQFAKFTGLRMIQVHSVFKYARHLKAKAVTSRQLIQSTPRLPQHGDPDLRNWTFYVVSRATGAPGRRVPAVAGPHPGPEPPTPTPEGAAASSWRRLRFVATAAFGVGLWAGGGLGVAASTQLSGIAAGSAVTVVHNTVIH